MQGLIFLKNFQARRARTEAARLEGPKSGDRVLGEGTASPILTSWRPGKTMETVLSLMLQFTSFHLIIGTFCRVPPTVLRDHTLPPFHSLLS